MIIKKKEKEVHEETAQKKKKVKSSGRQTVVKTEQDDQSVIKTEGDDWFETKVKSKGSKKKSSEEDECLEQIKLKKKKNKKKKACSELHKEAHPESLVNVESHLDLEPQEESEKQIKIVKKKKKKDQHYSVLSLENNQSTDGGVSNHHTGGTPENESAFKKSRKNIALNLEWDGEVTKKKKKGIFSLALEDYQDSEQKQSKKNLKKHKNMSQEIDITGKNSGTDIAQSDGENYARRKKKKKIKDKPVSSLPVTCHQGNIRGVHDSHIAINDFKKMKRKNSQEFTFPNKEEEDNTESPESFRETTKKKKKKSKDVSSLIPEGNQDYSAKVPDEHLPAQQEVESGEEELSRKKCRKNIKDSNDEMKRKKKKKIQKEEEETTDSIFVDDNASKREKNMLPESNEKNKDSEAKPAKCVTGDAVERVLYNYNPLLSDKNTKKRKKVQQDSAEEPGSKPNTKKKKIKRENPENEALEHMDDVTIVQEKKGNCDEINIDKLRRQALQEEIDRESGKTKVFSTKVEPVCINGDLDLMKTLQPELLPEDALCSFLYAAHDTKFGQWSTAAFQSPDRGMKFLRLMGGFKKGSVPTQDLTAPANKPNMALNREGEEKLQQALTMEFDKAMDLKQHRRIGLGFQPAANKKVYIDKYTSRSIKFED